jgi:pimeloyl-ACP methyl ester carboxylesterase
MGSPVHGRPCAINADVAVLLALAKKTKAPLHLVGHSYGAALALEAARTLGRRVKCLVLVEPVSYHLLRQEGRPEWAELEALGRAVLGPVANGDDRAAAKAFMTYWLGRVRWWLSPERFKTAIAATIPKVALEFGIAIDAPTRLADYAAITAPTLLIAGGKTRAPTRAVADDLLAANLPNAEVEILKGAGHMSPFTHPAELNRLILDFLARQR